MVNIKMIKKMGMEFLNGMKINSTKDTGKKVNNMEKVLLQ